MPDESEARDDGGAGNMWIYSGKHCVQDAPEPFSFVESPLNVEDARFATLVAPVEPPGVVGYLQGFGFEASGPDSWPPQGAAPSPAEMSLGMINGHLELEGHTWYNLLCHIKVPGRSAKHWNVQRRLHHLRKWLHDPVKGLVGASYDEHFKDSHFASHGGPAGTTERLKNWLMALSACINQRSVSPAVLALTLRFLEAPSFGELELCARAEDTPPALAPVPETRHSEQPLQPVMELEPQRLPALEEDAPAVGGDAAPAGGAPEAEHPGVASNSFEEYDPSGDNWVAEDEDHQIYFQPPNT